MSAWQFFEGLFPPSEICNCWLWDQLVQTPLDELRGYRLFRGHFLGYLEPFLGITVNKFTILRDPVERTISHYYHVRRAPDHPFHHLSLQLGLREFCLNPATRHMVENYQAAYLSTLCLTPQGSYHRAGHASALQTMMEIGSAQTKSDEWLLEVAQDALSRFDAVGTVERLEDSLRMFAAKLGAVTFTKAARVNEGANRVRTHEVDSETIDIIRALTAVDRQLHKVAAERIIDCKMYMAAGYQTAGH